MRLSDVKGPRTIDVIAECIEPIANIAADPEASRLFRREKLPEGENAKHFLMERIKECLPVLLKDHRDDVITVLAAISGDPKYAENLNLLSLTIDLTELLTDETFMQLFISRSSSRKPSGSAPVNTEEA